MYTVPSYVTYRTEEDAIYITSELYRNTVRLTDHGLQKEYAATNQALIELMDSLAADAGEEQLAYLTDVFVNCSRYELGFWDMAWDVQP